MTHGGRYSKYLPAHLLDRYQTAAADPELLVMRDEVALLDARLADLLARLRGLGPDPAGLGADRVWEGITEVIERRRKVVESERKRLVDLQQMITARDAMVFLAQVAEAVRQHVSDRDALSAISAELQRIAVGTMGSAAPRG